MTVVEQDRVRTLIRLSKARTYDATKAFRQRVLAQFPGIGEQGLWSLHSVSVEVRRDAQSSATAAPTLHRPCQPAPALALKFALLASGAQPSQFLYTVSEGRLGKGSYGSVWAAVGPEQVAAAIKSFIDKQAALVEVTACSSLTPHPHVLQLLDVAALSHDRLGLVFPRYGQNLRDFALERQAGCQAGELERAFELEELAHCALCLACGLEHVHAHGLTHTDVKPDNVLVTGKGLANVASEDFAEALRNIPYEW